MDQIKEMQQKMTLKSQMTKVDELLGSNILWKEPDTEFRNSVFMEVLIVLNELLMQAKNLGYRISFSDDVLIDPELKIYDVTDLISNFRNAACHHDSKRHIAENTKISFVEIRGKYQRPLTINGHTIEGKYEDDIAFVMGKHCLYLNRHIQRAFSELYEKLKSYLNI